MLTFTTNVGVCFYEYKVTVNENTLVVIIKLKWDLEFPSL